MCRFKVVPVFKAMSHLAATLTHFASNFGVLDSKGNSFGGAVSAPVSVDRRRRLILHVGDFLQGSQNPPIFAHTKGMTSASQRVEKLQQSIVIRGISEQTDGAFFEVVARAPLVERS
jgi:hypothetical protein